MREPAQNVPLGEWLKGSGPESDIVISSRVRVARNVSGFPLKARLAAEDETVLYGHLKKHVEKVKLTPSRLQFIDLKALDEIERLVLVERHLISLEHANAEGERGVAHDPTGSIAVMLNEEDHLRIQVLASGLAIEQTVEHAMDAEKRLAHELEFAFHDRFGWLTSCPTNVGTGMRISVMLHLPVLVFTKNIDKVFNAAAKMNLAVRGFYGEGTKAHSDLYQISNQVTLGKTCEQLLDDVRRILPTIVGFERELREHVLKGDRLLIEDRVWRAFGTLSVARKMTSEEAFEHLSLVRMGVHLQMLPKLDLATVNALFLMSQPGHLQMLKGGEPLEPDARDAVRAQIIRDRLKGAG